jgi:hypothetical protein
MNINWDDLRELVDCVPDDLDKKLKAIPIPKKVREQIMERDGGFCIVCERTFPYGSNNPYLMSEGQPNNFKQCNIHHIIPSGSVDPDNLVTLCIHCHQLVHQILYLCGKWKYRRPI